MQPTEKKRKEIENSENSNNEENPNKKRVTEHVSLFVDDPIGIDLITSAPSNTHHHHIHHHLSRPVSRTHSASEPSEGEQSPSRTICPDDLLEPTPEKGLSSEETLEDSEQEDSQTFDGPGETAEEDEIDPFQWIKRVVTLPREVSTSSLLPQKAKEDAITLVLDLDETLVHSAVEPVQNAEHIFPVEYNGEEYKVYARLRPQLQHFLERVSEKFEVVIFTASQRAYADKLLDILDPENKYIHHRLFREACTYVEGTYLKNLEVLGRDLSKTIIVDNSIQSFAFQLDNGILIDTWFDDPSDLELSKLLSVLEELAHLHDVRPFLREKYKFYTKLE